jgi:Holliday junction resolvasome RuvABC DNA-binding subunit
VVTGKAVKAAALPDEEIAYRLVKLYFEDVARASLKRKVDLGAIVNAYFYALLRLGNKEKELKAIKRVVEEEERELAKETIEQLIPEPSKEEKK